ncbi:peptidoglycan-N-acetylglucosamine deacetylase [Oxobacter pfennigii]|uniref:Peptidoglycan-N-acetylglucosamine deacetylase n=1 Tax=Oxobacter pfennigii TaxID=36849 RepID=A0A0P8W449_9CLOT|nr:polysaccharide deacetylase family protein [Oxobacter pfennigii]KPU42212.1 peptidoglycan-N-acetylglucosamine deacetylase [Oxobacter pfennigii]
MQVLYIRKKYMTALIMAFVLAAAAFFYAKGPGKEDIGAFINNEKNMPIYSVDVPDKRVALTFNVAWGAEYTQEVIDILKRYNIKATFFLTGAWISKYPDEAEYIYKYGHDIGNHTTTNVALTNLSKSSIIKEIKDTEDRILKVTGIKTSLLRVPYGEYNERVILTANELGYNTIQWDVDSFDWTGILHKDIHERVIKNIGSGSILLFHCESKNTVEALPSIIEDLRKQGYKFITVTELLLKDNYYIDNSGRQRSLK